VKTTLLKAVGFFILIPLDTGFINCQGSERKAFNLQVISLNPLGILNKNFFLASA